MTTAAIDNDVLYKGVCYGLLSDLIAAIPARLEDVGFLAAARFVLASKLRRARLSRPSTTVLEEIHAACRQAQTLEPTEEEINLAADLEHDAQIANLDFDAGESQLCAMVMEREIPKLVTGDKRAIKALEQLMMARGEASKLAGKLVCLEQLIRRLVEAGLAVKVRTAVCGEAKVDGALTLCFSCSSPEVGAESWSQGLLSHIAEVRAAAPHLLDAN